MPNLIDHLQVQAARTFGFRSRRVQTSEGRVHVVEAPGRGELPPLLLMHGLSSSAADYVPLLRRLRPHVRRVVAVDLPGHGLSDVPRSGMKARAIETAMLEALRDIIDEPVAVYGNSLGGMAAVRMANQLPEQVRALLLASPGGAPQDHQQLAAFIENFRLASHALARDFVDKTLPDMGIQAPFAAVGVRARFARAEVKDLLADLHPDDLLRPHEVAGIRVPLLLSWGQRERLLPQEQLQWFLAHLPGHARFETPEDHGHAPYVTRPDDVAERILAFLRAL